jgi:hypothetical protein
MRIHDDQRRPLAAAYLALSDAEAEELIGALQRLLAADPGWHQHVSAADYQTEITVYREDDQSAVF